MCPDAFGVVMAQVVKQVNYQSEGQRINPRFHLSHVLKKPWGRYWTLRWPSYIHWKVFLMLNWVERHYHNIPLWLYSVNYWHTVSSAHSSCSMKLLLSTFKNPCQLNLCGNINGACCSSHLTDASLSLHSHPTCHSCLVQTTQVITELQPARPRCSPAADCVESTACPVKDAASSMLATTCLYSCSASGSISLHPLGYGKEENILREVVGSQPSPVKLSGSHMALAEDKEKTCTCWSCWTLLEVDGSCGDVW